MRIGTRTKKIQGDIRARKGRTALVALAIFIGAAGTIAMFSMGHILIRQAREDVDVDTLPMAYAFVTIKPDVEQPDNEGALRVLEDLTDLTEVMGVFGAEVQFATSFPDTSFEDGYINAYSDSYAAGLALMPVRLVDGNFPAAGQVMIEQRMAEAYNLKVGDELFLRVFRSSRDPAQDGAIGTVESRTITGIVFQPFGGESISIYAASVEDANYITGRTGLTNFVARYTDLDIAEANIDVFSEAIANQTDYIIHGTFTEDPDNNEFFNMIQTLGNVLGLLALIALVVSGFMVVNIIMSLVGEQRRQIATMKTLGATRLDNFIMYAGIAFSYGVIGVIPGIVVGIVGGNIAAYQLAPQVGVVLAGFQFSLRSVVLGVVVGLIVPPVFALIPVFFGTRVTILEAITNLGIDEKFGHGPLARLITRLPVPTAIRQGIANVAVKKARLAFTVITLTIAVGASMGIFGTIQGISAFFDIYVGVFNADIIVAPTEPRDPAEMTSLLEDNSGDWLIAIEPGATVSVDVADPEHPDETYLVGVYGFDVGSDTPAFKLDVDEDEGLTLENASSSVVISDLLADQLGMAVGDTIVMEAPGNSIELTIVGIAEHFEPHVWAHWETLSWLFDYTYGPDDTPIPAAYYLITTLDDPTSDDLEPLVEEVEEYMLDQGVPVFTVNLPEFLESVSQIFTQIQLVLQAAAGLVALVGALGLMTTLGISVFERQKEIGVMRSIGASSSTIVAQFLTEGLVIGVLAWMLGLPLSVFIQWVVLQAAAMDNLVSVTPPVLAGLLGLVGMLLITFLASIMPSLSASRKTVSDILRYQ